MAAQGQILCTSSRTPLNMDQSPVSTDLPIITVTDFDNSPPAGFMITCLFTFVVE